MLINYGRLWASGCDFVSEKTPEVGWPVYKDIISFCKPKTIVHLVLNMVLQMLLKILLCNFFRASTAKEQLEYLTSDFYLRPNTTAKQQVMQSRGRCLFSLEKRISDNLHDAYSISYRPYLCCSFLLKYPKLLGSDCLEALFLLHTSLHCTMVLLGQIGFGMIQGCQTDVENGFGLKSYPTCYGREPRGKKK